MKRLVILIACATCLTAVPAYADYKIVTVDVNRVLNESTEAKTKRKDLDEMYTKAKAKMDGQRKGLEETDRKIKAGDIKADSKEADKFRADAREFARVARDSEEDLRKEFMKLNRTLTEKTLKVIRDYAQANKIDLVLDKNGEGRGPVLVGNPAADITDTIVSQVNH